MCNQFVQSVHPPGKHLVDNRRRVVFVFACCAGPELEPEPVKKPGAGTGTTVKFEWFRIPGFTSVVPAHPGSLGQRAVKRVCVYYG